MKAHLLTTAIFAFLFTSCATAQDITTVNAQSSDISDNLDLKAVASIFGDSDNLADFERRLNDPKLQISNLDLNNDNMVDYLRVIEKVDNNTHVIVLQSIIGKDLFQDVATIEVEKDSRNRVQVQVVGDVYMYGNNYIYEPVYVTRPLIYNTFWVRNYRPYYSNWYYNYYPSYYYAWTPYPIYTYHQNIHYHINTNNHYYYADNRKSTRAVAIHRTTRARAYENQNPNRSFAQRTNVNNRRELVTSTTRNTTRSTATATVPSTRNDNSSVRNTSQTASNTTVRSNTPTTSNNTVRSSNSVRNYSNNSVRTLLATDRSNSNVSVRYTPATTRSETTTQSSAPTRSYSQVRSSQAIRTAPSVSQASSQTMRSDMTSTRSSAPIKAQRTSVESLSRR